MASGHPQRFWPTMSRDLGAPCGCDRAMTATTVIARPPGDLDLGNANPAGIFQTRVYGFDGLQTRVPGFMIMSVWRAAGSYCRPTVVALVSGHLSWLSRGVVKNLGFKVFLKPKNVKICTLQVCLGFLKTLKT